MAGEWSVTARNGRGRERPRCAANTSPGEHGSSQHAKIHTPKLRAHAKRKRTLAILAPAGYLRMVYTAAERSRRTRGAGQSRRGVQPTEWLRHAHEARGRRKRGVRTVHSIHRRAPQAPRAMQHGKTYMYASPGVRCRRYVQTNARIRWYTSPGVEACVWTHARCLGSVTHQPDVRPTE